MGILENILSLEIACFGELRLSWSTYMKYGLFKYRLYILCAPGITFNIKGLRDIFVQGLTFNIYMQAMHYYRL
jgi:hypothetical protein